MSVPRRGGAHSVIWSDLTIMVVRFSQVHSWDQPELTDTHTNRTRCSIKSVEGPSLDSLSSDITQRRQQLSHHSGYQQAAQMSLLNPVPKYVWLCGSQISHTEVTKSVPLLPPAPSRIDFSLIPLLGHGYHFLCKTKCMAHPTLISP